MGQYITKFSDKQQQENIIKIIDELKNKTFIELYKEKLMFIDYKDNELIFYTVLDKPIKLFSIALLTINNNENEGTYNINIYHYAFTPIIHHYIGRYKYYKNFTECIDIYDLNFYNNFIHHIYINIQGETSFIKIDNYMIHVSKLGKCEHDTEILNLKEENKVLRDIINKMEKRISIIEFSPCKHIEYNKALNEEFNS